MFRFHCDHKFHNSKNTKNISNAKPCNVILTFKELITDFHRQQTLQTEVVVLPEIAKTWTGNFVANRYKNISRGVNIICSSHRCVNCTFPNLYDNFQTRTQSKSQGQRQYMYIRGKKRFLFYKKIQKSHLRRCLSAPDGFYRKYIIVGTYKTISRGSASP